MFFAVMACTLTASARCPLREARPEATSSHPAGRSTRPACERGAVLPYCPGVSGGDRHIRPRKARGPARAGEGEAPPRPRPCGWVHPETAVALNPERPAPDPAGEKRPPRAGRALAGPLRPGRDKG